ncbi:hypothetical protein [Arthrobacter sp. SLBN-53]|uniref:hypothetical protein n=1 Tax=Arthrobacter sp. SLBN-53 TaxID=2768412 RepID=UPI001151D46C|nr:hypothetical protein [Arthrobacter sp. SLBN-53]TQK31780.1 hypothetical protein FBY28_4820 [Arthrobacter sp. SLBN-53]
MPISQPADATSITGWTTDDGEPFRMFTGSSWLVPVTGDVEGFSIVARHGFDIPIEIRGVQFDDGRASRWVAVGALPEDLPVETARMLAESLAAAVAEVERHQ